jgi:5-methylcytosine-specific restriction protein A
MPMMPPKPCSKAGCRVYATSGSRCDEHQRKAWASNEGKTSSERGYGAKWRKVRKAALHRDLHLCQVCRKDNRLREAKEVDHIINKADGGDDSLENLQAICTPCHKLKTQKERNPSK